MIDGHLELAYAKRAPSFPKPPMPRREAMAELKTKRTDASVKDFLSSVEEDRRDDCQTIVKMMKKATGAEPKMWGPSIVGFGEYKYRYPDGREMDWMLAAFSPRKRELVLYFMPGFERYNAHLAKLGKHKTGKSCLYIKRLADVDLTVLQQMIDESVSLLRAKR
jgi:hypothetical protein